MSAPRPSHGLRFLLILCLVLACVGPQPVSRPPVPPPSDPEPPPSPGQRAEPPARTAPVPQVTRRPPGPLRIRVGLATDLERLDLPCCDDGLELVAGGERWPLDSRTAIAPADIVVGDPVYRFQVASLKDERQAQGIAEYLARATGQPADAVFDADTDLYKVRYGRFASREEAEPERESLAGLGLAQAWVTSEGGTLENPGFTVTRGGRQQAVPGRWLEVERREGSGGIGVHGGRFRGRILLFLNDRGLLNLINDLEIEEYLRGVVPRAMGPELYNQLEALKAQTVAARTYAVRNLGEFSSEGYDICSTPRCQVYGGMKVEHRFSDRAIAETAGQVVLFEGEPAETFYGSTCGGHTENVEVVFPLKRGAYLKGVPCMEAGQKKIAGDSSIGAGFPEALTRHLLPPGAGPAHQALSARLEQLARAAGLSVPRDRLGSMERREVLRFVASVLDLALDPRVLSSTVDASDPPPDWRPREIRFANYVMESGLLATAPEEELDAGGVETLLYHLALYLGVLETQTVHFMALGDGELEVRTAAGREAYELPRRLVTFHRRGTSIVTGPLELAAGDRVELYWHRHRLVAAVQPVEAHPVSLVRHAPRQRWSFFMSQAQVASAVQARYPGFPFEGFEVLSRGVSGRVGRLRLLGTGGRTVEVEGLAVRWTLDIPDTNFKARRQERTDQSGWYFQGRGWGHGVGMCQAGAFGMAVRRLGYREILEHYYSGVELGRVVQTRPQVLG